MGQGGKHGDHLGGCCIIQLEVMVWTRRLAVGVERSVQNQVLSSRQSNQNFLREKGVECENMRGMKEDTRGFGPKQLLQEVPFTEMGNARDGWE